MFKNLKSNFKISNYKTNNHRVAKFTKFQKLFILKLTNYNTKQAYKLQYNT